MDSGARMWRRKLLAFKERPDADNRRPPYYGSWSRTRHAHALTSFLPFIASSAS